MHDASLLQLEVDEPQLVNVFASKHSLQAVLTSVGGMVQTG